MQSGIKKYNTQHKKSIETQQANTNKHNIHLFKLTHGKIMGNDEVGVDPDRKKDRINNSGNMIWEGRSYINGTLTVYNLSKECMIGS